MMDNIDVDRWWWIYKGGKWVQWKGEWSSLDGDNNKTDQVSAVWWRSYYYYCKWYLGVTDNTDDVLAGNRFLPWHFGRKSRYHYLLAETRNLTETNFCRQIPKIVPNLFQIFLFQINFLVWNNFHMHPVDTLIVTYTITTWSPWPWHLPPARHSIQQSIDQMSIHMPWPLLPSPWILQTNSMSSSSSIECEDWCPNFYVVESWNSMRYGHACLSTVLAQLLLTAQCWGCIRGFASSLIQCFWSNAPKTMISLWCICYVLLVEWY